VTTNVKQPALLIAIQLSCWAGKNHIMESLCWCFFSHWQLPNCQLHFFCIIVYKHNYCTFGYKQKIHV